MAKKLKKKEVHLTGTPNPKQAEFFRATNRHIAYGGARGGGKSWAMRRKFVILALSYKGLKLLLLRRTLPELRENHVLPLLAELDGLAKYDSDAKAFIFPNKSRLKLGYCDTDADVLQYQGQEYDVIGFEEATLFTEYQIRQILLCNRSTRDDFKARAYYTCNPGGVSHHYIKRLFIDRCFTEEECPDDYYFIQAKVYDNTVLMDKNPEYLKNLKQLPEDERRAFLEGDWDVFAGQYFREFKREKHVIEPIELLPHQKRFRSIDDGFNDPCCVLWHYVGPDGRIYTYRELYVRHLNASEIAKLILEMSEGEEIDYTVASPDMWAKRGNDSLKGESKAETYMLNGVPLIKADNSRILGWSRMREFLRDAPDGLPYWQIFNTCKNLIRTLPLLVHDKHRVEDVADGLEDHAPESARYALMSRPRPYHPVDTPKQYVWEHEKPVPNPFTAGEITKSYINY